MTTRVDFVKVQVVGKNPVSFSEPITLSIVLEVFERVPEAPIDVKFTWAPIWDFPLDQDLDELEVGPLTTLGKHEFTLQSDGPDFSQIPDPTGPTALLVSFSYKGSEFLHLGFNVTVTCEGDMPDVFTSADQLSRFIGKCHPKFTSIQWDASADDDAAKAKPHKPDCDSAKLKEESTPTPAPTPTLMPTIAAADGEPPLKKIKEAE